MFLCYALFEVVVDICADDCCISVFQNVYGRAVVPVGKRSVQCSIPLGSRIHSTV